MVFKLRLFQGAKDEEFIAELFGIAQIDSDSAQVKQSYSLGWLVL